MADNESEKADALSQKILDNARKQAQKAIDRAQRDAEKLLAQAEREGQEEAEQIIAAARQRAETEAMKVTATIPVEVKRRILDAEEAILRAMLEFGLNAVAGEADKNAEKVLKSLVLNAALIMHENNLVVEANEKDRARISVQLLNDVVAEVRKRQGRSIILTLSEKPVSILGGAIVHSASGRLLCDNSFEARLDRSREDLRLKLAKLLFDERDA